MREVYQVGILKSVNSKLLTSRSSEVDASDETFSKVLFKEERQLSVIKTSATDIYTKLYDDLDLYVKKLPNDISSKYVKKIIDLKMVYIAKSSHTAIQPSYAFIPSDKLSGVFLNSDTLEIDIETGETLQIDECILGIYAAVIKASVVVNAKKVMTDTVLHKQLITYLNFLFLRQLKFSAFTDVQRHFVFYASAYVFYRHFLRKNHSATVSLIKNEFPELNSDNNVFDSPNIELLKKYDSIKYIGNILLTLNIIHENPKHVLFGLLKSMNRLSFYSIVSNIDTLIVSIILSTYPSTLYSKSLVKTLKNQTMLEKYIESTYMSHLSYATSPLF